MLIPWEGVQLAVGEGEAHTTEHALHEQLRGRVGFALGLLAEVRLNINTSGAAMTAIGAALWQFVAVSP